VIEKLSNESMATPMDAKGLVETSTSATSLARSEWRARRASAFVAPKASPMALSSSGLK
jgi:hypothetical protein